MLGVPLIAFAAVQVIGPENLGPDLVLALFISTAAPPVMAAPAFIYLLGLNGTLSLALSVAALIITPLSAPFIGELMLGDALPLSIGGLAAQLSFLLVGSFLTAMAVRKIAGQERIARGANMISGLNVLLLLIFAIAAMDGVAASFADRPGFTLGSDRDHFLPRLCTDRCNTCSCFRQQAEKMPMLLRTLAARATWG